MVIKTSMIKLIIELSSLQGTNLTGIGIYTTNLIGQLIQNRQIAINGCYKISRFKHFGSIKNHSHINKIYPLIPLIPDFYLKKYHLIHGPDYWVPNTSKIKKVVTIHDFSVYHSGLWDDDFAKNGRKSIEKLLLKTKPDEVIVVSDFVKNELLERFPQYENKVHTVYHGADHFHEGSIENLFPIHPKPYILCLGTVEYRKNQWNLAQSFNHAKLQDVDLIFIGGNQGFMGEEITKDIAALQNRNIIYKNYLPTSDLEKYLKNALFTVYPSKYEGFGFPILESMAMGVPVLTSNFGAMSEIAGEAAYKVNCNDIEELRNGLSILIENSALRQELINRGTERVKTFTWEKCATETVEVYKNALC